MRLDTVKIVEVDLSDELHVEVVSFVCEMGISQVIFFCLYITMILSPHCKELQVVNSKDILFRGLLRHS